jgi:hypothetical protein
MPSSAWTPPFFFSGWLWLLKHTIDDTNQPIIRQAFIYGKLRPPYLLATLSRVSKEFGYSPTANTPTSGTITRGAMGPISSQVSLQICIMEVPVPILAGTVATKAEVFRGFPQYRQAG